MSECHTQTSTVRLTVVVVCIGFSLIVKSANALLIRDRLIACFIGPLLQHLIKCRTETVPLSEHCHLRFNDPCPNSNCARFADLALIKSFTMPPRARNPSALAGTASQYVGMLRRCDSFLFAQQVKFARFQK